MSTHDAAASMEGAPRKRSYSPGVSCTHDQLTKRLRMGHKDASTTPANAPELHCLHCDSSEHTWTGCVARCKHCQQSTHAGFMCPALSINTYLSPAFTTVRERGASTASTGAGGGSPARVSGEHDCKQEVPVASPATAGAAPRPPPPVAPSMDGVSAERLAMIAVTPATPGAAADIIKREAIEGGGPMQSGMNTIPLGNGSRRSSISTAAPPPHHYPNLADLRAKVESTPWGNNASHPANRMMGYDTAASLGPPPPPSDDFAFFGASRTAAKPPPTTARRSDPPRDTSTFIMTPNAVTQADKFRSSNKKADKKDVARFGAAHMGIWADLTQHISDAVHGACDSSRNKNNGRDAMALNKALNAANNMLRPFILREKEQVRQRPQRRLKPGFTQVRVDSDGIPIHCDEDQMQMEPEW